nr:hypothetical protein [Hymenobacter terrenus]
MLIPRLKILLVTHAVGGVEGERLAGDAVIGYHERGGQTLEWVPTPGEQQAMVRYVGQRVEQAPHHVANDLAPLVGGLDSLVSEAEEGDEVTSYMQLRMNRRHVKKQ